MAGQIIDEQLIDGDVRQIRERLTADGWEQYAVDADGNEYELPAGAKTPRVRPGMCLTLIDQAAVAELVAVSTRTIRRWEQAGNLPKPLCFGSGEQPELAERFQMGHSAIGQPGARHVQPLQLL